MTASFSPSSSVVAPRRPSAAAAAAIFVIAAAAAIGLFIAGVTFIGLAIAFPIAVPVAIQYHVAVSASDVAIAEQFATYWPLFSILGFASLVGAVVVAVKALAALSPTARD